jgi:N-acetylmuramoyl-L-alanine amidase
VDTKYFGEVISTERSGAINRVVLHHTGGSTASGAIAALKERGLSVHYVIDTNGIIYYLVSESRKAFHSGCCFPSQSTCCGKESCFLCINDYPVATNDDSIGIEIVNTGAASDQYTAAQYESLDKLLNDIVARRQQINDIAFDNTHIVAHYQISPDKWDPSHNFDWGKICSSSNQCLTKPLPPGNLAIPVPASAGYP